MKLLFGNEIGKGNEETHKKYLDTLGNLTLTGINSELGNLLFREKKKMYAESGISMNRDLCRFDKWSDSEIVARAESLAGLAVKIWPRHVV